VQNENVKVNISIETTAERDIVYNMKGLTKRWLDDGTDNGSVISHWAVVPLHGHRRRTMGQMMGKVISL